MTLTMTQTCVQHVLRLLPAEGASFACGICFPYACACTPPTSLTAGLKQKKLTPSHQRFRSNSYTPLHTTSKKTYENASYSSTIKSFLFNRTTTSTQQTTQTNSTPKQLQLVVPGRQTNIEAEKAARRNAIQKQQQQACCARCNAPPPSSLTTTRASNAENTCRACHIYTSTELATHKKKTDMWISICGGVYNITNFAASHPGGILPLQNVAGCDASDVFRVFHTQDIMTQRLPSLQIGRLGEFDENGRFIDMTTTTSSLNETPMQSAFHQMITQIEADGLFQTNFAWYTMKISILVLMLAGAVFLGMTGIDSTSRLLMSACLLGMFWQQLAFLGHDLGHNSVGGTIKSDWFGGLCVTAFFGVSVQWWKRNHNVHHVVTNSIENDPDIQHMPVFTVSEKAFGGFYSTYYERLVTMNDSFARWLIGHQHYMYYPIMFFVARINLYVQSILLMCDIRAQVKNRHAECCALAFFYFWYILLLTSISSSSPSTWFWYTILSHAVAGLVHIQITLSHFAMPVYAGRGYSGMNTNEAREHFLRCQFDTSLDISCPTWLDWLHGGLQFQVTHHLIPRVPRHNLRTVREQYVKPFARKFDLPYHEMPFGEANVTVYNVLKTAALASRVAPDSKFCDSHLWQAMQAEG